jgi:Holliday junction resolvasome RuvABC endonuclease subunit
MILGLDVSTTKIGVAILSDPIDSPINVNGSIVPKKRRELLLTEYWDLDTKKYPDMESKMEVVMAELSTIRSEYEITDVYIEEHVKGTFHARNSNIRILLQLAMFNGLVRWACYDVLEVKAIPVAAGKARSTYGISFPRRAKSPERKRIIVQNVVEKEGDKFEWSFNRGGKNYATGVDDRADAVVVARFGEFAIKVKNDKPFLEKMDYIGDQ